MFVGKHNMQYKINLIIILSCIYLTSIFAKPVEENIIFDLMKQYSQNCSQLTEFLNKTKVVPLKCDKKVHKLKGTEDEYDDLICYGLLNAVEKVCLLSLQNTDPKFPISDKLNQKEFEKDKIFMSQNSTESKVCYDIAKHIEKSSDFNINLLWEKIAHTKFGCLHICTFENGINPLCVVLHMLYSFIDNHVQVPLPVNNLKVNKEKPVGQSTDVPQSKKLNNIQTDNEGVINKPKISDQTVTKKNNTENTPSNPKPAKTLKTTADNEADKKVDSAKAPEIMKTKEAKNPDVQTQKNDDFNNNNNNNNNIASTVTEINHKNYEKTKSDTKLIDEKDKNRDTNPLESDSVLPKQEYPKKIEVQTEETIPVLEKNEEQPSNMDYGPDDDDDDDEPRGNELDKKPDQKQIEPYYAIDKVDSDSSHIFLYFTMMSLGCILLYIMYLSKQKILATFAKLRRSRNRNRRRPSTANYRKLDCTLEEAVTSQCNANVTHVIY